MAVYALCLSHTDDLWRQRSTHEGPLQNHAADSLAAANHPGRIGHRHSAPELLSAPNRLFSGAVLVGTKCVFLNSE